MYYSVINSGGVGSRFWPLSRKEKPKQFLQLTDNTSLLELAFQRLDHFLETENIHICTTSNLLPQTMQLFPQMQAQNYITEPCARNTAPAIAISTAYILKKDPNAVIAFVNADHYIPELEVFADKMKQAMDRAASHDEIILLGITPTFPSQAYGYIQAGEKINDDQDFNQVSDFREKPNEEVAQGYIDKGNYFWNAGMFIAKAQVLMDEITKQAPELAQSIARITEADFAMEIIEEEYNQMQSVPMDIAVIEKSDICTVLPVQFKWEDLGSWNALQGLYSQLDYKKDEDNNIKLSESAFSEDSKNCLLQTKKPVAVVGLENIAVIEEEDCIVVINLEEDQKIKALGKKLPPELL